MGQELLKDVIYRRIKEMIIVGTLPMGAKLSESVLMNKLEASKAPIRDALKRLQAEGLVQRRAKSGTFVLSFTQSEFNELLEFRYFIEGEGMKLASKHNLKQLIQELSFILDKMEVCIKRNSILEYLQLDNQFHQCLISACGNRYFQESYELISSRMATARNHLGGNEQHLNRSFEQHVKIIKNLRQENIEGAQYQLMCHILPEYGAYWGTGGFK